MKTGFLWRAALVVAACGALAILVRGPASAATPTAKQKGMSYAAWWSGVYATPDADLALTHLNETGTEWISLIVTVYQADLSSTTIYTTSEATPTDADLIHVIERAHHPPAGQRPFKVMLKPHVDLANDPTSWRGEIGAGYGEAQWSAWFASYRTFIEHYATLAQTYGVDQFCVGTELMGTSLRASQWRQVIAGVRARYTGPITYASNGGGDEVGITWWDAVDFIGVDAYYPISDGVHKTLADLRVGWTPHVATLANLAATWHKSIILTEIGYRSQDGSTSHPWDWVSGGAVNCQEQADAYQSALESVWNQPWLAGVFWWDWGTDPFGGGCCNNDYTPHDKPAEDILRAWYGGARPAPTPAPQPDYSRALTIYHDSLNSGWDDWSWSAPRNLAASDQVYSGTHAISVSLAAWGGLSFWHEAFDATPYSYLEFYIRGSAPGGQHLWAMLQDETGAELRTRPVDDCRYIAGGAITSGVWKRVLIPLSDLDAAGRHLTRLSIMDSSGQGSNTFWLDELRLVGARWQVSLPLVVGWNLVSLPLAPSNTALTATLASLAGHYDEVYAYDAADTGDPWKSYIVGAPPWANDLAQVNERMGLWIHARDASTLTLTGTLPLSTTIVLKTGWNLVGYPGAVARPITEALSSIAGRYDLVYAYEAADHANPWHSYSVAAPPYANDLAEMRPGVGYWVRARQDCVWTVV